MKDTPLREKAEPAVPRGVLQPPEPRQFQYAERGDVHAHRRFAHGGRDHQHVHHLAADSVRSETALVGVSGKSRQRDWRAIRQSLLSRPCFNISAAALLCFAGLAAAQTVPLNATRPPVVLLNGWETGITNTCPVSSGAAATFGNLPRVSSGGWRSRRLFFR